MYKGVAVAGKRPDSVSLYQHSLGPIRHARATLEVLHRRQEVAGYVFGTSHRPILPVSDMKPMWIGRGTAVQSPPMSVFRW